jgi:hypothetical protein
VYGFVCKERGFGEAQAGAVLKFVSEVEQVGRAKGELECQAFHVTSFAVLAFVKLQARDSTRSQDMLTIRFQNFASVITRGFAGCMLGQRGEQNRSIYVI